MDTNDWSQFRLRIPVKATQKEIYDAWTSQQGLESWFLRKAVFSRVDGSQRPEIENVQIGDSYVWMWHGWPDDVIEKGVVLQENGTDVFKFSFGKAGHVTVTIKEEEGETVVNLLQDEIPVDENSKAYYHIGCTKGWVFYLANLKSIFEGGIDLRNRNELLKDVVNS